MRCVEVIRELAARAGGPASAGMTEHLASCPRCARWAERDAKLERLWEATRPHVPSTAAWEALWAGVSSGRAPSPAPGPVAAPNPAARPVPPRRWCRAVLTLAALAQAAAVLAAVLVLSRHEPRRPPEVVATTTPTSTFKIEIDPGAPVIFGPDGQVRTLAQNENSVDRYWTMFNAIEAMAPMQSP